MSKFKDVGLVFIILIVAVVVDIFREATHIPVTLMDIVFFPFFVFIIFYAVWAVLSAKWFNKSKSKARKKPIPSTPLSIPAKFGVFVTSLGMLALGIWAVWEGILQPGKYFSGVRGAMHGYTMVPMGLCIIGISILMLVTLLSNNR